jgi:N utilization substance protein B
MQSHSAAYNSREELMRSLESAYKLYNYLLALVVKITDYRREQLEAAQNKYMPTEEERYPNMRFVENQLAALIRNRSGILAYCEEHELLDDFDTDLYRSLLGDLMQTPTYLAYMEKSSAPNFDEEKAMWREFFTTVIPNNKDLDQTIENKDLYWNDDLSVVNSFVVKTLQRVKLTDETLITSPMFRCEEDRHFAMDLYDAAVSHFSEYMGYIDKLANNWDLNRIAHMDRIILICAMAEIVTFPDIATNVSINEYIELAKHYSTPSSSRFINGILDRFVKSKREEGVIFKA